jgi:hypothetical protein
MFVTFFHLPWKSLAVAISAVLTATISCLKSAATGLGARCPLFPAIPVSLWQFFSGCELEHWLCSRRRCCLRAEDKRENGRSRVREIIIFLTLLHKHEIISRKQNIYKNIKSSFIFDKFKPNSFSDSAARSSS